MRNGIAGPPPMLALVIHCRGESGWCSDVTSTHGAWRHAGVQFLLSGVSFFFSSHNEALVQTLINQMLLVGFEPTTYGS